MSRILSLIVLLFPAVVWADQSFTDTDYGRVVRVEPVVEMRSVRQEPVCREEQVPVTGSPLPGQILGGVLGGLAGSQVGKGSGKSAATAVGATAGTIIGGNLGGGSNAVRTVRRCDSATYERIPQTVAYTVLVEFAGRVLAKMVGPQQAPQVGDLYPVRISVTLQ